MLFDIIAGWSLPFLDLLCKKNFVSGERKYSNLIT